MSEGGWGIAVLLLRRLLWATARKARWATWGERLGGLETWATWGERLGVLDTRATWGERLGGLQIILESKNNNLASFLC